MTVELRTAAFSAVNPAAFSFCHLSKNKGVMTLWLSASKVNQALSPIAFLNQFLKVKSLYDFAVVIL